jgi:hypothetical protein
MTRLLTLVAAVLVLVAVSSPASANIVYIGLDPSSTAHTGQPQAAPLVCNATQFASGGLLNPRVAVFQESPGGGFGFATPARLAACLPAATVSVFSASQVAAVLGGGMGTFDVLYFAPTTLDADIAFYTASAAGIAAYANGGGGLVVEPNVFAAASWTWVPDAAAIGHSGPLNVGREPVTIVESPSPLNPGGTLTTAGLSGWGFSVHSNFTTPGAAGYTTFATDSSGPGMPATIIYRTTTPVGAVPEPTSLALMGLAGLGLTAYAWRRRKV